MHRLLDAFNRGDFSALSEIDPAAELQDEPRMPGAGWNHGHAGAVRWAVKLWQSFGRLRFEIDEPVASAGCLVARWHATGTGKRSGIRVDMEGYCLFGMRRARVWRVEFYETEAEAMSAARSLSARARDPERTGAAPQEVGQASERGGHAS